MTMRQATIADLDDIVNIVLAFTRDDPNADYRYPLWHQYEKEYTKNIGLIFEYFIKPDYVDWHIMVIEAPDPANPETNHIAAVAVWDISYINKRKHGDSYQVPNPSKDSENDPRALPRLYVDEKRLNTFRSTVGEARKRYFTDVYGSEQIHLESLITHQGHWRRGYASRLVRWGMEKAKEDGIVLTNFATVMGMKFYPSLGFRRLDDVVVQAPGDEKMIIVGTFVYDPSKS